MQKQGCGKELEEQYVSLSYDVSHPLLETMTNVGYEYS